MPILTTVSHSNPYFFFIMISFHQGRDRSERITKSSKIYRVAVRSGLRMTGAESPGCSSRLAECRTNTTGVCVFFCASSWISSFGTIGRSADGLLTFWNLPSSRAIFQTGWHATPPVLYPVSLRLLVNPPLTNHWRDAGAVRPSTSRRLRNHCTTGEFTLECSIWPRRYWSNRDFDGHSHERWANDRDNIEHQSEQLRVFRVRSELAAGLIRGSEC